MNKIKFIEELKTSLGHLPKEDVIEIIRDQEEYIRDAMAAGRSEDDVLLSLGSPKAMAANFKAETKIASAQASRSLGSQVSGTFGAVLAVLALAPLNLLVVLGPFIALLGILVGGWSVAGAVVITGVAMVVAFMFKLVFFTVGAWTHLSLLFFTLGTIGLGILSMFAMAYITRWFFNGTLAYLKWNLKFIQARA
jgi:uncharacterized membrane protein